MTKATIKKKVESAEKVKIFIPEDVKDKMLHFLKNGKVKGSTTYSDEIDKCWKWRKQEANIWSGYANEGKSLFLKQLALIKALQEGWKFAFSSPEDYPPEEFFDDMIHTLAGKSTDRDNTNRISEELYVQCFNLIKDKFFFVYMEPPNNTIRGVLEEFKKLHAKHNLDAVIIDPLLKFARPKDMSERDDIYASYVGSLCVDFCRETNTSLHLIMHQLTPSFDRGSTNYAEPNMYRIKGGGSWADGFDNILTVWRPNYATDKFDPTVQFSSQKIKKQKLVGIPQKIELGFCRKSNRYVEECRRLSETHFELGLPLFNFDSFLNSKTK